MVPHARAIEERARAVQQTLHVFNGDLCGTLRVLISSEIAQFALAPILPKFRRQRPKVALHLEATSRRVDLIGEGFDVEIRADGSSLKDSTLLRRVVARTPWCLAAAPEYLQSRAAPTDPSGLRASDVLYFGYPNDAHHWELQRGNYSVKVAVTPSICCNDMAALRIAAIQGGGIVGLPVYVLDSSLKQEQLVPILPEWRLRGSCISIITPPKRQSSRLAKCFTDFVATELPVMTNSFGAPNLPEGI
jgi:DNA-binding transcriptional LysR family regulator